MTFTPEDTRIPTSIGSIAITLTDQDGVAANHIATFVIEVEDQDGDMLRVRTGNLEPHLEAAQKTAIVNFLDWVRDKAVDELLPE